MTTQAPDTSNPTNEPQPLLRVRELKTWFRVDERMAKAVDGVSLDVYPDETLGIVGESGSGKTVTALSIMRLIPDPPGLNAGGEIWFGERDLLKLSYPEVRDIRGDEIGMVFQEPMTALNPVFTIGMQVIETVRAHRKLSRRDALTMSVEMLERVGIPAARRRMKAYPHQFSGGMLQRVMIAMALICNPRLLIADEPTTALDVTTQAQILDLMMELKSLREGGAIILITHDLAVVAETCQRVVVMYGGKIQEVGTVEQIFDDPRHPYTQGLLASLPARDGQRHARLRAIPGNVPSIMEMPTGCKFCTRCEQVFDRCQREEPQLLDLGQGQLVRCHLYEDQAG